MKLFFVGLVALVLLLVVSLHFVPSPDDRFTEVYFDRSNDLPRVLPPGVPGNFSFVVHNLEAKDMQYDYQVTAWNGVDTTTIRASSLFVRSGASVIESVPLQFASSYNRTKITVQLAPLNESIHFWVTQS